MSDYQPTPPQQQYSNYGAPVQRTPVLSILSLVFGVLGVLGGFLGLLGLLPSVAAIVLGFLGRRKEPASKGLWLTGLILGFVGVVLSIALFAVGLIVLSHLGTSGTGTING